MSTHSDSTELDADGLPIIRHLHLRPDWLARTVEEPLEPALPIVDPHHHLWEREGGYLLDELLADITAGHDVVATVYAQCGYAYRTDGPVELRPVGETEFVAGVAREAERRGVRPKVCAGIVGHADMELGDGAHGGAAGAHRRRRRTLPRHPPHLGAARGVQRQPARPAARRPVPASPASGAAWRGCRRSACPSTPGFTTRRSTS